MKGGLLAEVRRRDGALAGGQDNQREGVGLAEFSDVLGQQELSRGPVVDLDKGERTGRGDDGEGKRVECNHDGWMSPAPVRGPRSGPVTSRPVDGFAVLSAGDRSGFIRWPASGHDQRGPAGPVEASAYLLVHNPNGGRCLWYESRRFHKVKGPNGQRVPGLGWR